jgi:putative protease
MNVSENKRRAVGVVENYYPKQKAAAVKLHEEGIKVGDEILVEGNITYLRQQVSSLKKRGKDLLRAEKGDEIGLAVDGIVRKNDRIFII